MQIHFSADNISEAKQFANLILGSGMTGDEPVGAETRPDLSETDLDNIKAKYFESGWNSGRESGLTSAEAWNGAIDAMLDLVDNSAISQWDYGTARTALANLKR